MAKQTVDVSTLPTLDDFIEKEDLVGRAGFKEEKEDIATKEAEAAKAKAADENAKADKAKKDAEAERTEKDNNLKKTEEEKKKVEEFRKKEEEEKKKTGAKLPELTQEQLDLLVKKADEKPETLTEDERKVLIDKGLFEETTSFWEDVEKEHGIKVEVDYGAVDPESPKGAAIRDKVLMSMAATQQMEFLQDKYPEVYQILEHVAAGGQVQDLVSVDEPDYSKITLEKDDKEAQKELLTNFYLQKGFDDKRVTRMVEADEDSAEGLLVAAQEALKELTATQQTKQKAVIENQKAQVTALEKQHQNFKQSLKQITDTGKLGDFNIVSSKDKEDFYKFAVDRMSFDAKTGYQVVLPVNDKSVVPVLQQLFFGFKNGKLDEFVRKEAQSINSKKLLRKAGQVKITSGNQEEEAKAKASQQKALPTFDVFADNG